MVMRVVGLLFMIGYWLTPAPTQACARTNVRPPADTNLAYRQRNGRCEGLYATSVDSIPRPRLVGFHTQDFPATTFAGVREARLRVIAEQDVKALSLRAVSLRAKTYYAMDTELSGTARDFVWDADVLSTPSLAMKANEIGLLACNNLCRSAGNTLFYPVSLALPPPQKVNRAYVAVLESASDLVDAGYTLTRAGAAPIKQPLPGRYVAERPIRIRLGDLVPGDYMLRFTASTADGARTVVTFALRVV